MSYRIEISSTSRAVCAATICNREKVKIQKGELRQGVLVMFKENQSMKYRHWGCVTPTVLHNWWETVEQDLDLVDGFDELPAEAQQKVKQAFEDSHVADEDWNGDIECNRFDPEKKSQGMFLKGKAKQEKEATEAGEDGEPSPVKKPAAKKRARATADDDNQDEKPAKKSKAKTKKPVESADEVEEKPVRKRGKKSASVVVDGDEKPAPKKSRKKAKVDQDEDDLHNDDEPAPATKSSRRKKAVKDTTEVDKPKANAVSKRKKSTRRSADDDHDDE